MADRTDLLSQDTPPRAGQQTRVSGAQTPVEMRTLTDLGFAFDADPNATTATAMDQHREMAGLLADPVTVLLAALADWITVVQQPDTGDVVALVQAMDLKYGGTVAEGATARTTLLLAQLLRRDVDLRTEHGIPSAPAWAGGAR